MKNKRVMVIDALNQFLRAYIVNPTLSPNGDPVGGAIGFLKILQKLCREIKPDKVIICWDGQGGSKKRKLINKNYKGILIEKCHILDYEQPVFKLINNKSNGMSEFEVELIINNTSYIGIGNTKKSAEVNAAQLALEKLTKN